MPISDQDFNNIMGAAHPEEDSSPSAISDQDFAAIMGKDTVGPGEQAPKPTEAPSKGNSTLGQALGKGGLTGVLSGIAAQASDYVESEFPGALSGQTGEQYSPEFLAGSPQERRDYFKAQRASLVNNYYSGVDTSNHAVAAFVGQMAGSLVDPSTALAPANQGATVLARAYEMAKFGAALGATAGAVEGLADKGTIDPIHVVVTAAIGAAGGAVLQTALVEPLSMLASKLSARGRRVTPEDIQSALESDTGAPGGSQETIDPITAADTLNSELGLNQTTPEGAKTAAEIDNILGNTDTDPRAIDMDYAMGKADEYFQGLLADGKIPETKPDYAQFGKVMVELPSTVKETRGTGERFHGSSKEITLDDGYALSGDNRNIYGSGFYTTDAADISLGYTKKGGGADKVVYDVKENAPEDMNLYDMEAPVSPELMKKLDKIGITSELSDDFLSTPRNLREIYNEYRSESSYLGHSRDEVQERFDAVRDNLEKEGFKGFSHIGGNLTGHEAHKVNIYWTPASDLTIAPRAKSSLIDRHFGEDAVSKQMAEAQNLIEMIKSHPDMQAKVTQAYDQANAGDTIAMAKTGDEKILAAIADEQVPAGSDLAQKMEPSELTSIPDFNNPKPGEFDTIAAKFGREWGWTRPSETWKAVGAWGREAASTLEDFVVKSRRSASASFVEFRKNMVSNRVKKVEEEMVRGVLNGLVDASKAPASVQKAAMAIRKQMNGVIDDAVKQGLVTAEKGIELKAAALKDGYVPRVYNRALLRTAKGKADFIRAISDTEFVNKQAAEVAIKSIMGDKKIGKLANYLREGPNGKYFLDPEIAKYIWKNQTTISEKSLSSHLEQNRKFPAQLEGALQPFLERDFNVVMDKYFRDTAERLEGAKIFGNQFEKAKDIFEGMFGVDEQRAKSFREIFWATMNDPRSDIVRSFSTRSQVATTAVNVLKSLQLLKLTFSQLTNLTQLPVNGAALVARMGGTTPYQKFQIYLGGMYKGYASKLGAKEWLEEAQMSGAMLDSVIMHTFGAINPESSIGRGLIGPLAVFKDPAMFLKYTGFHFSEDINRAGGYHMGRGYIEALLKNRAKFEGMKPGTFKPKKLEAVYKGLEEVGISRDMKVDQVSLKQLNDGASLIQGFNSELRNAILEGGQRFGNKINHVNDMHKLPLYASSFTGKLMFQLHTFSYHQMMFAWDNVLKPMRQGNFLPFMMYMGVGTAAGMSLQEAKKFILADDSKYTMTEKAIQGQLSVAGFGLIQDTLKSATYGKQGVMSAIAGPGLSQVAGLAAATASSINVITAGKGGNPLQPLGKEILRGVAFPYKHQVMKQLQVDKASFEAKFERGQGFKEPKAFK